MSLAVIAVIVACKQRLVDVNGVGHSFAQTMAGENHFDFGIGFTDMKNAEV